MTSSTFSTGHVQSAARQSWRDNSPRPLLLEILSKAKDPHDREKVHAAYMEQAMSDERLVEAMADYWFDRNYDSAVHSYPRPGENRAQQKKRQEEKAEAIKANVAKVQAAVEAKAEVKAKLMLMAMPMPNGKPLAECLGREVLGFGTQIPVWLSKIAKRVPPTMIVGHVLSEEDLRKIAPKDWA